MVRKLRCKTGWETKIEILKNWNYSGLKMATKLFAILSSVNGVYFLCPWIWAGLLSCFCSTEFSRSNTGQDHCTGLEKVWKLLLLHSLRRQLPWPKKIQARLPSDKELPGEWSWKIRDRLGCSKTDSQLKATAWLTAAWPRGTEEPCSWAQPTHRIIRNNKSFIGKPWHCRVIGYVSVDNQNRFCNKKFHSFSSHI